jgi:hypothetical protein
MSPGLAREEWTYIPLRSTLWIRTEEVKAQLGTKLPKSGSNETLVVYRDDDFEESSPPAYASLDAAKARMFYSHCQIKQGQQDATPALSDPFSAVLGTSEQAPAQRSVQGSRVPLSIRCEIH